MWRGGRAGQGSIAPPACVGATPVEGPIDIEEGLPVEMPLVYFSGNVSPEPNQQLYRHHVERMAALLDKRAQTNAAVRIAMLAAALVAIAGKSALDLLSRSHCIYQP